jgi:glutamine amidotransferase
LYAKAFPPLPLSRRVIPSASEESPTPLTICLQLLRQKITNQRRIEEPSPAGTSSPKVISRIRFIKNAETPIFTISDSFICYLSNSYVFMGLETAQNRKKASVVIVDYGMGNLSSVRRKLSLIGVDAVISFSPAEILSADKLLLPGVGHFRKAVQNLRALSLWDALNVAVLINKKPILGICLGMQLMAKHSEEGDSEGFGWFDADVVKFRVEDFLTHKVPHTGWNQIIKKKESLLMKDIPDLSEFYFVHSYHFRCNNQSDILNETEYEYIFTNIFGVQYHPEKSHDIGEKLLRNFVDL